MRVSSIGKSRYFCTFIDDASGWCEVRFLKRKNEVKSEFEDFLAHVSTQQGKKVKSLRSDNGLEYVNRDFYNLLNKHGISRELTVSYTPEQNGGAERRNRTLMDTARCLLLESGLPAVFWGEAVNTANYIRNRGPSRKVNGRTPHECWTGKRPTVSYFKRFGSEFFVLDKRPNKDKLQPCSKKGIFVGYSLETKGFRVWLPEEKKVIVSRDVPFMDKWGPRDDDETTRPFDDPFVDLCIEQNHSLDQEDETHNQEAPIDREVNEEEPREPPENERRTSLRRLEDPGEEEFRGFDKDDILAARSLLPAREQASFNEEHRKEFNLAYLPEIGVTQALKGPDSSEWMDAMVSEVRSILENKTFSLVAREKRRNVVGSRFVLR